MIRPVVAICNTAILVATLPTGSRYLALAVLAHQISRIGRPRRQRVSLATPLDRVQYLAHRRPGRKALLSQGEHFGTQRPVLYGCALANAGVQIVRDETDMQDCHEPRSSANSVCCEEDSPGGCTPQHEAALSAAWGQGVRGGRAGEGVSGTRRPGRGRRG